MKNECQKSRDTVLLKSNSAFVDTHQTHSEQFFPFIYCSLYDTESIDLFAKGRLI
jgi:hypothetical protein